MASEQQQQESQSYDFIVIGAGPAGSAIASTLAQTPKKPSVLLIESGPAHVDGDTSLRILGNKVLSQFGPNRLWDYKSAPNPHLNDRSVSLVRGKGTGGGSAINFGIWSEGPKEDWERMAQITGDDAWKWENVKKRFNDLTTHHCKYPDVRGDHQKYIGQTAGNYGTRGPLNLGYPEEPEQEVLELIDLLEKCGMPHQREANNGSLNCQIYHPETFWRGVRSTAADLWYDAPSNFQLVADTHIRRVLFEQGKAVGVEAVDGRVFKASREVIVSAGAMDSPKILLHSGIGPEDQLSKFDIPVVHANPNVGQHFQDHFAAMLDYEDNEEFTRRPAFYRDKAAQKKALREWELYRTGPMASLGTGTFTFHSMAKDEARRSEEFAALPEDERVFLTQPNVPFYEIIWGFSTYPFLPDPNDITPIFHVYISLQYAQSRGSFTLQSADASVPLRFETNFFSNPFDKRQAIEATRKALAIVRSEPMKNRVVRPLSVPASDSDDDIIAFWRQRGESCYHGSSTCMMGVREAEDQAVVDTEFKVFGVRGLRVADNSIWRRVPGVHLQAHAYVIGIIVSEKIIAEHGLDMSQ